MDMKPSSSSNVEAMKGMDAEELRAKIDEAKAREQEEERIQASRAEARARAIAEHTAAGKDAFAHGDYREAERQFDLVMVQNPERPAETVCNRAACALKLGRYKDAVADAAEATYLEPSYVKAHYRLALAHQGLGNFERALKACRAAIGIDPSNAQLSKLRMELEEQEREEVASR